MPIARVSTYVLLSTILGPIHDNCDTFPTLRLWMYHPIQDYKNHTALFPDLGIQDNIVL